MSKPKKVTPAASRRDELKRRRRRFAAALADRGQTAAEFARSVGVLPGHVSLVLHGKRVSAKLTQAMEAFIAEYEQEVVRRASQPPAPKVQQPLAA